MKFTYTREKLKDVKEQLGCDGEPSGSDVATSIKEINLEKNIKVWVGTQEDYESVINTDENTLYFIKDDLSIEEPV